MTQQEKYRIWELHQTGFGYKKIVKLLNLNEDTVKSYIRRTSKKEPPKLVCEECGKTLIQKPKTKPRRFCSDRCRLQWWSKHPNAGNRSGFSFICEYCGKEFKSYKNFLGYRRGKDGKPQIVESEAKIVRKIYRLFLEGLTPTHIARTLTEEGIPTPGGKVIWQNSTVESILTNEKYKGDALLQKKYTVDFLSKKQKLNEGEVPQYYVEGSHEGIVTAEVFDLVQYELHRRKSLNTSYCSKSPFSSRLICGECGGTYGAKIWDSNNKYRREIYQCNHRHGRHSGDGLGCKTPHLTADEIKGAFIGAFNSCIKNRREIINNCITAISEILDTSKLEKQASNLSEECAVVTELIRKCVDENAHISVDPKVYAEKYEQLAARYAKAKDKLDKTETEIANRNSRKNMIAAFLDELEKQEHLITDFDTGLWNAVIESMTIYSKEHIVFKFKGGTEIKWSIV